MSRLMADGDDVTVLMMIVVLLMVVATITIPVLIYLIHPEFFSAFAPPSGEMRWP